MQYEVNFSYVKQEAKLIIWKGSQKRLTRLCSAKGSLFPFIHKGKRTDKTGKNYMQVIPILTGMQKNKSRTVNHIPEPELI